MPPRSTAAPPKGMAKTMGTGPSPANPTRRRKIFNIVLGLLGHGNGLTFTMVDGSTLNVSDDRGGSWDFPVTVKDTGKLTNYTSIPMAAAKKCEPIARFLHRLPDSSSKGLEMHRLMALVVLNADFKAGEQLGVHHPSVNGGDNRACNLMVLSMPVHDRVHREVIDRDVDGYLAGLAGDPTGISQMPLDLAAAVATDRRMFEGHHPPPQPEFAGGAPCGPTAVTALVCGPGDGPGGDGGGEPDGPKSVFAEVVGTETEYNPDDQSLKDLSLDFRGFRMIVTATYLTALPAKTKDGDYLKDANGRQVFEIVWDPLTASTCGAVIRSEDDLPAFMLPSKEFSLEGQVDDKPRFSKAGMRALAAGARPPADLADRLVRAFERRVVFSGPGDAQVCVACMASTYMFKLSKRAWILAFGSSIPACGKSTALEVCSLLAFNAHLIGRGTLAVLLRLASNASSTLILDEVDELASDREGADKIGFLACRTDRGARYMNMGPTGEVRAFDVFGPTVVANLKGLVHILQTREIGITLAPRAEDGDAPPLASTEDEDWLGLRDDLLLWAAATWQDVKHSMADPAMRVGSNRHADKWLLPLAVAYHLGGQSMFEQVWRAADAASSEGSADDLVDAMALALAAVIRDKAPKAGPDGGFHVGLEYLLNKAKDALEEDQRKDLHSKRVAKFAREHGLVVRTMTQYGGSSGVEFKDPGATLRLLRARYPHLRHILGELDAP